MISRRWVFVQASKFGPCSYFVLRRDGGAVGAIATHIDDILGRRENKVTCKTRVFLGRGLGRPEVQETSCGCVGAELPQEEDFAGKLTQGETMSNLKPLLTSPEFWTARQHLLPQEAMNLRQCKSGEPCRLVTVYRPDIRARLARITPRINSQQGDDVYRTNVLVQTVQARQQDAVLKYAPSPNPGGRARGAVEGRMRASGEKIHRGTMSPVGWSDAFRTAISRRKADAA